MCYYNGMQSWSEGCMCFSPSLSHLTFGSSLYNMCVCQPPTCLNLSSLSSYHELYITIYPDSVLLSVLVHFKHLCFSSCVEQCCPEKQFIAFRANSGNKQFVRIFNFIPSVCVVLELQSSVLIAWFTAGHDVRVNHYFYKERDYVAGLIRGCRVYMQCVCVWEESSSLVGTVCACVSRLGWRTSSSST